MSNILQRFADIMSANFEGILEKYEKPDKMIDQYMKNLEHDLGEVKAETAKVMAIQKGAERRVKNAEADVLSWTEYAEAAVKEGNDDDARKFLEKQVASEKELEAYKKAFETAADNSRKMQEMHKKLMSDIGVLRAQRDELITQYTVAKTSQSMSGITNGFAKKSESNIAGFNRMKEKIIFELDVAEAANEINENKADDAESLKTKYSVPATNADIEGRLSALKSKLAAKQEATA